MGSELVCGVPFMSRSSIVVADAVDYRKAKYEVGCKAWLPTGSYSGSG